MRKRLILMVMAVSLLAPVAKVSAVGEEGMLMKAHCKDILVNLKNVQREDAKARVHLGAYFEDVIDNYIKPFNVMLVENNLSNADFVENQNEFAKSRVTFANDFTKYQQMLEELVAMDCEKEPDKFYEELVDVRKRRKTMEQDVLKMQRLISEHVRLVEGIRGKI